MRSQTLPTVATPLRFPRPTWALGLISLLALGACEGGFDIGVINPGLNDPALAQTAPRPQPDSRGIISYPTYQVAVGRQGDSVADLAGRIGLSAQELASYNGLAPSYRLRGGEVLALPRRVTGGVTGGGGVDIAAIAGTAIDSAGQTPVTTSPLPPAKTSNGLEPIRHKVERGETAYSIARLYSVSVTSLASWNGLGANLSVREGQQLLIPIVETPAPRRVDDAKPGTGSTTPTPPSAVKPLPAQETLAAIPPSPNLGQFRNEDAADRKFLQPVQGKIISAYSGKSGGNEGIDIAASPGTAVKAAEDGEVALISQSVGANTIVLLRHPGNIYTVYSNITDVDLSKGQKIKRGQRIGVVTEGSPSFLHFEVRRGTQSVNPAPFL